MSSISSSAASSSASAAPADSDPRLKPTHGRDPVPSAGEEGSPKKTRRIAKDLFGAVATSPRASAAPVLLGAGFTSAGAGFTLPSILRIPPVESTPFPEARTSESTIGSAFSAAASATPFLHTLPSLSLMPAGAIGAGVSPSLPSAEDVEDEIISPHAASSSASAARICSAAGAGAGIGAGAGVGAGAVSHSAPRRELIMDRVEKLLEEHEISTKDSASIISFVQGSFAIYQAQRKKRGKFFQNAKKTMDLFIKYNKAHLYLLHKCSVCQNKTCICETPVEGGSKRCFASLSIAFSLDTPPVASTAARLMLKFFSDKAKNTAELRHFKREVDYLHSLKDSQNVVRIYHSRITKKYAVVYEELSKIGSLSKYLTNTKITPSQALDFIQDMLFGLAELEKEGIVHRDLDPDNFLLMEEEERLRLKFSDFDKAIDTDQGKETDPNDNHFCSPEGFQAIVNATKIPLNFKEDIWYTGMTSLMLRHGNYPIWTEAVSLLIPFLGTEKLIQKYLTVEQESKEKDDSAIDKKVLTKLAKLIEKLNGQLHVISEVSVADLAHVGEDNKHLKNFRKMCQKLHESQMRISKYISKDVGIYISKDAALIQPFLPALKESISLFCLTLQRKVPEAWQALQTQAYEDPIDEFICHNLLHFNPEKRKEASVLEPEFEALLQGLAAEGDVEGDAAKEVPESKEPAKA